MALTINTNIKNEANGYSLDASQVKGGYVVVADQDERNAIPAATKVNGTTIYQADVGKEYRWNGSEWLEASSAGLDSKLDKQTAQTESDQVYGKLADGSQTMFDVTMGATATTIPRRDTAGRIQVADGVSGNDAVNFNQLSAQKEALETELNKKQPTLVSGTNIKTINGNSLLGSGDLVIAGGGGDVTAAGSNIFTGLNSFRLNTTFGGTGESASDPVITVDSGAIRFRYNGLFDCGQLVTDNANDKNLTYKYNDAVVKFPKKSGTIAITDDLPVANPTAAGTVTLTKLKVGDVVYDIPQGGGSGVDIVQTTGQSTTAVMSQKAVTEAIQTAVDSLTQFERMKLTHPGVINITYTSGKYEVTFEAHTWFVYGSTFYETTAATTVTFESTYTVVFCMFKKSDKTISLIPYTKVSTLNPQEYVYIFGLKSTGNDGAYSYCDLTVPFAFNGNLFGIIPTKGRIIGGNGIVSVDTTAKTITFPKDTIIMCDDFTGYINAVISTGTVVSYAPLTTSGQLIIFNRKDKTFTTRAWTNSRLLHAFETVIAYFRTTEIGYPFTMDIGVPYEVDGKLFGNENIRSDDLWQVNNRNIKAINHRGYNTIAPENTLPAYKLSRKYGYDYVECDISFTSDNVPVLLHDNTIDRTSNGTGAINSMTFEQVRTYDFGSWKSSAYAGTKIPSLEEFISLCKVLNLQPYIELKSVGLSQENVTNCVNIVKKYGMLNKVTWISFLTTALDYVLTADPKARIGLVQGEVSEDAVTYVSGKITSGVDAFIDAQLNVLTEAIVNSCITANVPLEAWNVFTVENVTQFSYVNGVTVDSLNVTKALYEANL